MAIVQLKNARRLQTFKLDGPGAGKNKNSFFCPKINCQSPELRYSYYLDNTPLRFVESHKDLGVTVDCSLRFHLHIQTIAHKAAGLMSNILRSTLSRSPSFMIPIYKTYIRPLLEYSQCVWATGYIGDLTLLENIQRRWTRNIDGMQGLEYSERLLRLELYSVKGRLLRADLIKCWKIFHNKSTIKPHDIFSFNAYGRTRGHKFKIFPKHVNLECRKRFFSERCIKNWNDLPNYVVEASSIDIFKKHIHDQCRGMLYSF